MKKTFAAAVAVLASVVCITSCSYSAAIPSGAEPPAPPAAPRQRAEAVLAKDVLYPDAQGLALLRAELDKKLEKADAAAAEAGLEEDKYYRIIRDEMMKDYLEGIVDAALSELENKSGAEYEAGAADVSSQMLCMWSQFDDLTARLPGYVGVCRALCEGDDVFDMSTDARDLTGDGGWPEGYFFDGFLPAPGKLGSFLVCDEYLRGYGMDDAQLCAAGADEIDAGATDKYIESVKEKGFYTYMELREEGSHLWYGCFLGDDGSRCFAWVQFGEGGQEDMLSDFAGGRNFLVLTGNFDFELCLNTAVVSLFL